MNRLPSEPPRLIDLRAQEDPTDVARLVRSAMRAPMEPVPLLKGRIRYTLRRKSAGRRRYLRFALVGAMLFVTGGVVGAVVQPVLRLWQQPKVDTIEDVHPVPVTPHARQRRASAALPQTTGGLVVPEQPTEVPSVLPSVPTALPPPLAPPATSATGSGPALAPAKPSPGLPEPARFQAAPARAPAVGPKVRAARAHSPDHQPVPMAMLEPPRPPDRPAGPLATIPPPATVPPAYASAAGLAPMLAPVSPAPATAPSPGADGPSPRPAPAGAHAEAVRAAPPPPPSEQALLSRAVRSLRSEHRPASALAVLDEYVARFPGGSLLPEAARLRTEALLALGQKPAALAELNRGAADGTAGGEGSRLARAELHASAGRWREALEDFDALVQARLAHEASLGLAISPKVHERLERALWGRASARSHLGDDAGARADLRECLRRFPQGRFATQAARLLGDSR